MLVYHGKIIQKNLDNAQLKDRQLHEAIREHGIKFLNDVDMAILEVDGNISVLSKTIRTKTIKRRKVHKSIIRTN
jgi:uncharacterized membrane protein YcaP (DUF421 family)